MSSHRVIRKPRFGSGQSARRVLTASRSGAAHPPSAAAPPVKVEDVGDGMARLTVSEMLPRAVAERIARILSEGGQPATPTSPDI